jgi:anion-transporting  ArsA/GET3 family ATPase
MATDKMFTVCGTSKHPEQGYKVRFANDALRIKVLTKSKHTDITLVELPEAMTKLEAVKFIKNLDEFSSVSAQAAIADYLDRNDEKPAKATAKAPAKATKAAPKAKAKAKSEDAPFSLADAEDAPL